MNFNRDRGSRPVRDHRKSIAAAVLGTTGGLVLLFHYNGIFGANAATPVAAQGMAQTMQSSSAMPSASASATKNHKLSKAAKAKAARAKKRAAKAAMASGMASNNMAGNNMGGNAMGAASVTVLGPAVTTRWGVVQVKLTVQGGKITAAETVQSPHASATSQEINARALPILNQEAVKAQSAMISAVSGASVTSGGYVQSLQAAVDKMHM